MTTTDDGPGILDDHGAFGPAPKSRSPPRQAQLVEDRLKFDVRYSRKISDNDRTRMVFKRTMGRRMGYKPVTG